VAVIVVIGELVARTRDQNGLEPAGPAAGVALAAAAAGASVEIVSRVGDDPPGDAVVLGLAQAGVGHVATIRDAAHCTPVLADTPQTVDPAGDAEIVGKEDVIATQAPPLDAADVGLALRYLSDYRVIVLMHPTDPGIVREAAGAAAWAAAHLVVVTSDTTDGLGDVADAALVMTADPDAEGFAAHLGRYAAAVDAGQQLDTAYAALTAATV
jgi:sugar/nucleoside kinase (ribokinase family)